MSNTPKPMLVRKDEVLLSVGEVSVQFCVETGDVLESDGGEVDSAVKNVIDKVRNQISDDMNKAISTGDFAEFHAKYAPAEDSIFGLSEIVNANDMLIGQAIKTYGEDVFDKVALDKIIRPALMGIGDLVKLDYEKTKDLVEQVYPELEAKQMLINFHAEAVSENRARRSRRP